jgi:diguanylate cyclase (GGDEF)-like protein/PAS domain S-box-containing protein
MTRELRRARDALEDTLNAVPDLLLELDGDGRIHHYRSARSDLACVPPEDQIGRLLAEVLPPEAAAEFMSALAEARAQGHSEGRQYCVPMHGALRWFELSVARKEGEGGSLRFIALARDVSSRHEAEAAMHRLAHFDALTALPNRRLLLEQMHAVLLAARNGGELGGLFYIDLDNFKQINDARGHEVGDHLLVQAAKRLRDLAAPADTVARLGGDEFVMLVPHLGRDTGAARLQALQFAQRLRDSLDAPYAMDGARYSSTASIGVTLFPKGAEGVLLRAGHACRCAGAPGAGAGPQERGGQRCPGHLRPASGRCQGASHGRGAAVALERSRARRRAARALHRGGGGGGAHCPHGRPRDPPGLRRAGGAGAAWAGVVDLR